MKKIGPHGAPDGFPVAILCDLYMSLRRIDHVFTVTADLGQDRLLDQAELRPFLHIV